MSATRLAPGAWHEDELTMFEFRRVAADADVSPETMRRVLKSLARPSRRRVDAMIAKAAWGELDDE